LAGLLSDLILDGSSASLRMLAPHIKHMKAKE
jgi:hypothetical protein